MAMLLKPDEESVKKAFNVQIEATREFAERMGILLDLFSIESLIKISNSMQISSDDADPLKQFRSEFKIPPSIHGNRIESIYLCGNSLGCLPKRAKQYCDEEFAKWGKYGVEGHFQGKRPWAVVDEPCVSLIRPIIGAKYDDEVAIMNSLSVNNNLLFISFYRPTASRYKILIEGQAFCSDHHTVRSHLDLHDLSEADALIEVNPKSGASIIRTEDILNAIEVHKGSIALVWIGVIQYYTGQWFDVERITKAAHRYGI